ncbi:hypothetical protein MA16_Dca004613 [Dendrobium catenatum]|uniref:Uncharacterized protein n=1 Tax=Dendrobium catenatum TaxID=906689 RepID=A0A2I0VNL6_9ASPA|nr:hypothetical protein MA16_Dca004613 [Dendrobium catenatum]
MGAERDGDREKKLCACGVRRSREHRERELPAPWLRLVFNDICGSSIEVSCRISGRDAITAGYLDWWIEEGDNNSKVFHAYATARQNKNWIDQVPSCHLRSSSFILGRFLGGLLQQSSGFSARFKRKQKESVLCRTGVGEKESIVKASPPSSIAKLARMMDWTIDIGQSLFRAMFRMIVLEFELIVQDDIVSAWTI